MNTLLKHCPLCGAMAKIKHHDELFTYRVHCTNPSCKCNIAGCMSVQESIEKWNRRYDC